MGSSATGRRLAETLEEIEEISRELREAADGEVDTVRIGRLRSRLKTAEQRRDALLEKVSSQPSNTSGTDSGARPATRDVAADALALLQAPAERNLVVDVMRARFQHPVRRSQMSSLLRDERRAYDRAPHSRTFVGPALSGDGYTPVRGLLARSDWPFPQRLVTGLTPRVAHLRNLAALVDELERLRQHGAETEVVRELAELIGKAGRGLSGVPPSDAADWERAVTVREAAHRELEKIEPHEQAERAEAARTAPALSPSERIWGRQLGEASEARQVTP